MGAIHVFASVFLVALFVVSVIAIEGGESAVQGMFPFQVALYDQDRDFFFCSGSIISDRWVLTAGHCFWPIEGTSQYDNTATTYLVIHGVTQLSPLENLTAEKVRKVVLIRIHHLWNVHLPPSQRQDIALLQVDCPFVFESNTNTLAPTDWIQLLTNRAAIDLMVQQRDSLNVTGWGIQTTPVVKVPRNPLQWATLPTVTKETCENRAGTLIGDAYFCAGGVVGTETCSGDSGGPIFRRRALVAAPGTSRWEQVGMVVAGTAECGQEDNQYGVYLRMPMVYDWIAFILAPDHVGPGNQGLPNCTFTGRLPSGSASRATPTSLVWFVSLGATLIVHFTTK